MRNAEYRGSAKPDIRIQHATCNSWRWALTTANTLMSHSITMKGPTHLTLLSPLSESTSPSTSSNKPHCGHRSSSLAIDRKHLFPPSLGRLHPTPRSSHGMPISAVKWSEWQTRQPESNSTQTRRGRSTGKMFPEPDDSAFSLHIHKAMQREGGTSPSLFVAVSVAKAELCATLVESATSKGSFKNNIEEFYRLSVACSSRGQF